MYKLESLCIEKGKKYFEIFSTSETSEDFHWFYTPVRVYFRDKQKKLLVRKVVVAEELELARDKLEDALLGKQLIPQEFQEKGDIGLLLSDFWQEIAIAEEVGLSIPKWGWDLSRLILFNCDNNKYKSNNTFLYSDEQGNVVLQISTVYPWAFRDAAKDKDSVDYDTWRPTYTIIYKDIIAKDVVKKWLEQLDTLIQVQRAKIGF